MKEQDGTAILRTRYLATECENRCFDRSTLGFIAHVLAEHDRSRDFFPPRHEDHPGFDSNTELIAILEVKRSITDSPDLLSVICHLSSPPR
jgi:hypothetical protein